MTIYFGDPNSGLRFKKGRIVFCRTDSVEFREWAPSKSAPACKQGEELKIVQLDDNAGCDGDVFSFLATVDGPCMALIQDWVGATFLTVSKG
jgi:hypothetical protein